VTAVDRAPDAMGPTVSLHRCATYADAPAAIEQALAASGLDDRLRGQRVLLKPNLMKGAAPERCTNTHPAVVGALTRALVARGSAVLVGDSSGLLGFTDEVFQSSGVADAVRAAGGTVVNLDAGPFVTVPVAGVVRRSFVVPRVLFEVDAVVQVPKLKAHSLTGISAAMKNLIGVMPGATKCALHVEAPAPRDFSQGILDLFLALGAGGAHLEGAVVDAVWALAGRDGRDAPIVSRPGLVLAGRDLTAVDVACARVLGFDPGGVPTIRAALQRRVGPATWGEVELRGEPLPRCAQPAPGCPPGLKERSLLAARAHYWMRGRIVVPDHDAARCTGQRQCVAVCPVDCIRFEGARAVIGPTCIGCYACHEVCPTGAMRLRAPWPLRGVLRERAEGLDLSKVTP
jgi:uncharacterized protein (DUF362 family)/NAD-dependent dihydropyrimidine dehydrogenase PreA subunit